MKRIILIIVIAGTFLNLSIAQKTFIYNKPEADYKLGLELFSKQQYGAAQMEFSRVINAITEPLSELKCNSQYYYGICAAELLNDDAEDLLTEFVNHNGQSLKAGLAYFQLARLQYRKKEYSKAVQSFLKVDRFDLTKDEVDEYYFKTGYSYFRINKMEDAARYFNEIKERENKYQKPAIYYSAHIAYSNKNYQSALDAFQKLSNDADYKAIVPYYIVQIYYMQGKYDQLLKIAPKMLDSAKAKMAGEISRLVGESYYRTGKYKEAIPYLVKYRNSVENGSTTREEDYELGYCYYKTAAYKDAVKLFEKVAVKDDSLTQNSNYHAADCYVRTNQKQFARNAFLAANKLSFNKEIQEDALYNYCKLSYELAFNPYNEAISSIQKYIQTYPQSGKTDEMYSYLVNIYLTTRNYKDALKSIESIKTKNEKIKGAYQKVSYCRAVELFSNKDFPGAISLYNKTISIGKEKNFTPKAYYWKGEAYYRMANLDSAVINYKTFLVTPGAYSLSIYSVANYNIGYCYFKKTDYNNAILAYRKFVTDSIHPTKEMLNDAYNRLGDCYFKIKDNAEAVNYYSKGIRIRKIDADYALYQKSLALGVMNKNEQKVDALKTLLKDFKKSSYADDAYFELANTYQSMNDNASAIKTYEKLIEDSPNSIYTKRSMLKIGLIQRNMNKDQQALTTFKKVVAKYPSTAESKEALVSIKNIYVDMSQVDSFFVYVKNIPFANITNAAQDSITYVATENRFMNGDCDKAIKGFDDYLKKFPEGIFVLEANYYKAECDYSSQNYDEALKGYTFVISKPKSKFTENSLLKAAEINYKKKNYAAAIDHYKNLENEADYKNDITVARTGQMRAEFLTNNYAGAIAASRKLLTTAKLTNDLMQEAHLTIAKSALMLDSTELAKREFVQTSKLAANEMAAESKYNIALLLFKKGNYEESEKQVFELINQVPSYDYWIAKGFILLADNYIMVNNYFQAKQTLQSIIDNYEGEDLKKTAEDKLNSILEKERLDEQKKAKMMLEKTFGKDSTDIAPPVIEKDSTKSH